MNAAIIDDSVLARASGRSSTKDERLLTIVRIVFWLVTILAGASQAWTGRNTIANDGISYLDMGDAFAHGHAEALINGYWSPLYPAAIGLAIAVTHPSPRYEFATVQGVNFLIFLMTAAAFEFLLGSIMTACRSNRECLPSWFIQISAYIVFLWTTLCLITVSVSSPDMLLALFVFLAAGILVRIASGSVSGRSFAGLGAVLGMGYVAKAPLFPLSFVFLAVAMVLARKFRVPVRRSALALVGFLLLAGPLVFLLSASKHRLTFGDSGRLNYAWYVDSATYRHWQGEPLGLHSDVAPQWTAGAVSTGVPVHPTRRILDDPTVFEFASPVGGTYPVWYDPSYWDEGLRAPISASQELRKLLSNARFMYALLLNVHAVQLFQSGHAYLLFSPLFVLCCLALICFGARPGRSVFWDVNLPVIVPALAAFAMYLLVYSEPRHLGAFVALLFTGFVATLRVRPGMASGSGLRTVAIAIVLAFALTAGLPSSHTAWSATRNEASGHEDWQVVEGLRELGLKEGMRVASLTYSNHYNVRWARLAHAQIVAELFSGAYVTSEDAFWKADEATRNKIIGAFASAGADVIVSRRLAQDLLPPAGWQRIGATRFFVFRIPRA